MLILLPPSEGKTPAPAGNAPVCFADLSFPELTAERESVLEELATVSSGSNALAELKVGASLEAEVERNTLVCSLRRWIMRASPPPNAMPHTGRC